MWRQLVEEGLVFLQEGGVFGLAREPFALGRIGLLVVEFERLDLIREARRVGAMIGAVPFDGAVAWRSLVVEWCQRLSPETPIWSVRYSTKSHSWFAPFGHDLELLGKRGNLCRCFGGPG